MRRLVLVCLAVLSAACAHTDVPYPAPAAPPAPVAIASTTAPCNPGHSILNATMWVQHSAEYEAVAIGTFASARRALDAALTDESWVGALEESGDDSSQPPAIIVDADETVIDNVMYQARAIRAGTTFDSASWKAWVDESAATPVPGAKDFLTYAQSRGVTIFYVTNRDHPEETEGTRRNLQNLGYPMSSEPETLLLRGARPEWKSDKSTRRAHVAQNYRVLLLMGDDLNDFVNAREKTKAEREALLHEHHAKWGTRWFMLPNPMYGSFERATIGSGGTPCEQLQRKVDALIVK